MRNKVLLVEDDHLIVENLTEFLTREGFEIRSADGQQKAMELLLPAIRDAIPADARAAIQLISNLRFDSCRMELIRQLEKSIDDFDFEAAEKILSQLKSKTENK